MRLDDERESSHYEVQDGRGGGFGGGGLGGGLGMLLPLIGSRFGCGGIVVVLIIMVVMGMNPLSLIGGGGGGQQVQTERPATSELSAVQRTSLQVLFAVQIPMVLQGILGILTRELLELLERFLQ